MKRAIPLQIGEITAKKGKIFKDFSLKAASEFNRFRKIRISAILGEISRYSTATQDNTYIYIYKSF